MIYANGRAYPKLRLVYITDRDLPPSPAPKPTEKKAPKPPPATGAGGADLFALYLRVSVPPVPPAQSGWAAILTAAQTREQAGWGGLHATLCSFKPKLSSGAAGHHGGSLKQTALAIQQAVWARNKGSRWRMNQQWPPGQALTWITRGGLVMVGLAGGQSRSLALVAQAVQQAGMVNARGRDGLHMTLGQCSSLPPPPPPFSYPPEGAPPQPLPEPLVDIWCTMSWSVAVVKLPAGQQPASDNELFPI